jgi:hypothetical protein
MFFRLVARNKINKLMLTIVLVTLLIVNFAIKYIKDNKQNYILNLINKLNNNNDSYKIYTSDCDCKKDKIILKISNNNQFDINLINTKKNILIKSYNLNEIDNFKFTCNHYNTFKRGKNLKILSYSLYGTSHLFYYNFVNLVRTANKLYPDWILRVYYDDSIDLKVKCKIECLTKETNELIDNVDFCNIKQIPIVSGNRIWDATYMHAMTWRWLPIGDSFVDVFSSRDLDSHLIQREVDAVNQWINKSNYAGHIMRGKLYFIYIR